MKTSLERARVSDQQVDACVRVLAAANHRQWMAWQQYVIPYIEDRGQTSGYALHADWLERLAQGKYPPGLRELLSSAAIDSMELVRQVVGGYTYEFDLVRMTERKSEQFRGWVRYASSNGSPDNLDRWKLQCRTPFVFLPPDMQRSDYTKAWRDLDLIRMLGGLVLPYDLNELTAVEPLSGRAARSEQRRHRWGFHGNYTTSVGWGRFCHACHGSIGGYAP